MPKRAGKATYFPGKRGRSKNFFVSKVDGTVTLGAATSGTVVLGAILDLTQDAYLISADLTWAMRDHTAAEGPIEVGLANSVLSTTEVSEAVTATPNSQDDRVALEQTSRPVREAGAFPGLLTDEVLNNGNIFRTKLKMVVTSARDLNAYARNVSGATLTTGTIVRVNGKVYGTWK